jgi:NADH-quinone oxidoreductase subunit C
MEPADLERTLRPKLGDRLLGIEPMPGTAGRVRFDRSAALDVFRAMRDDLHFEHLSFVGGIDWEQHREVVYALWSDRARQYAFLSTELPMPQPHVESATPVWPSANWHERETWEMVDITFDHHPDLRHLLMPDGYAFHPLLRSFTIREPEEIEVKTRHV